MVSLASTENPPLFFLTDNVPFAMDTGSKGPPLRLENLGAYLDDKLEHETQVLDLLIVAQARGQTNQELWDKLHSAALRDDRLSELAFAYEKLNQDRRVRIMPPANQAQIFLNAARFFVRALGDLDGAQAAFERVLSLVPGHPEAFEQLRRILEDKGEREKLIGLHLASVGPKTEKDTALEHLRAALALAVELDPDRASKIGQQILKLDPSDFEAIEAICASLESAGKFPELARALEHAVAADPPPTDDKRIAIRVRLLELYDDKVPEVERAAPHIEEVLAADKDNAVARRVAARLLQNKSVAARVAGALEDASEHPIGRAIAVAARDGGAPLPPVTDFTALAGLGVRGRVEGRDVLAGRPALLAEHGIALPPELDVAREDAEASGRTAIAVAWDGDARAVVEVADTVRPTSAAAVRELRALGLSPVLLTGDNARTAAAVAAEVGIDEVIAGVLPEEKEREIRRLQDAGRVVAMVGDGVNDAPALARADLGLAMGTGTDAAIEASDLTLVRGDLRAAPDAVRLSRRTLRTIRQNLFWAFAYNVAALPLAALGMLNPMIAGAAMACSSLLVVGNALRLRRFTPSR